MKIKHLVFESTDNSKLVLILKSLISKADEKQIPGNFTWDQINTFMTNIGEEEFSYETFKIVYDSDPSIQNLIDRFDAEGINLKTKAKTPTPDQGAQQGDDTVNQMAKRATANAQAQELAEEADDDSDPWIKSIDDTFGSSSVAKSIGFSPTGELYKAIYKAIKSVLPDASDNDIQRISRETAEKATENLPVRESDDEFQNDIMGFLTKKLDRAENELQNAPATTPEEQENKEFGLKMFQFMKRKFQEKQKQSPKTVDTQRL
jgi:hypothetical protein